MKIVMPTPGAYVVAVSGGVDSMALLHMLHLVGQKDSSWQLTIAHFDHGIRPDSAEDRRLVQAIAHEYGLQLVYKEANLGGETSEAKARESRYAFLQDVLNKVQAEAIVTAHHQDDLLETAIINMLRGTGRKGLTSLQSSDKIIRPLLQVPKQQLIKYAEHHNLKWHEDTTNQDQNYLRNYVRHAIMPRFDAQQKSKLLTILNSQSAVNKELDAELSKLLIENSAKDTLPRTWFNHLPYKVSKEVMAAWLRHNGVRNFDRKTLDRLVTVTKVTPSGRQVDILNNVKIHISKDLLALDGHER
jgi:tRNA(Ile)-lysidine synthase